MYLKTLNIFNTLFKTLNAFIYLNSFIEIKYAYHTLHSFTVFNSFPYIHRCVQSAPQFLNIFVVSKRAPVGNSLAVQWLRICAPNARGTGLIPGWGTKIPHAVW